MELKKFSVLCYDKSHWMGTAEELYEEILHEAQTYPNPINWLAPADVLTKVCNEKEFPKKYSVAIKILILNCFAEANLKKERYVACSDEAWEAVYSCYNSLPNDDESTTKVKEKFLSNVIQSVIKYDTIEVRVYTHEDPAYSNVCKKWKISKFEQYKNEVNIDFKKLIKDLYADFDKMIKTEEEKGTFTEDDERVRKENAKFWAHMLEKLS